LTWINGPGAVRNVLLQTRCRRLIPVQVRCRERDRNPGKCAAHPRPVRMVGPPSGPPDDPAGHARCHGTYRRPNPRYLPFVRL